MTVTMQLHNTLLCKIADCTSGSVKVYDGSDTSATLLGTFCGSNIPTVLTSGDKNLYIVYTSTDASSSFKASWKKVTSMFEIKYIRKSTMGINSSNLLRHGVCINRQL